MNKFFDVVCNRGFTFLFLISFSGCGLPMFAPTVVQVAPMHEKGTVAVSGGMALPNDQLGARLQGQVQYAFLKNCFVTAGGYGQAGSLVQIFNSTESYYHAGYDAGIGYIGHLSPMVSASVLAGYGGQFAYTHQNIHSLLGGTSTTNNRYAFAGPWVQGLLRFRMGKTPGAVCLEVGGLLRSMYARRTLAIKDNYSPPAGLYQDGWIGNRQIWLSTAFLGITQTNGKATYFYRALISPLQFSGVGADEDHFYYSPLTLEVGISYMLR